MKKIIFGIASVVIFVFCAVAPAAADYRFYVWTYQFMTMPPGETELETYVRMVQSDRSDAGSAQWKRQIELETGLTEKWDISMYLVDSYKATDGKSKFDELKLRSRYKLAEKGKFIVDPLLYVEYKIKTDRSSPDLWETKLILAKDVGDLNVSANLIPAEDYNSGTKVKEWKMEYAAGASYPLVFNRFFAGVEVKGNLSKNEHALGPVFSFKGKNIWSAIGTVYGLNRNTADIQSQAIIGVMF